MIWELQTRLMIDWYDVETEDNTSMVRDESFRRREKLPEPPHLSCPSAWGPGSSILINEGGVYRCWSLAEGAFHTASGRHFLRYAESTDGLTFIAKRVGAVDYNGSRDNNLIDLNAPSGDVRAVGLMHDPVDKDYPFKVCWMRKITDGKLYRPILTRWPRHSGYTTDYVIRGIGKSRDGIIWEPPRHEHDMFPLAHEQPNLHRAMDGSLIIQDQGNKVAEWSYRGVWGLVSYDLETADLIPDYLYHTPEHQSRAYAEYTGPGWQGIPWIQPHRGLECARKGPTMLGLHGFLYGASGPSPTGCETFAQTGDVGLAISQTGILFRDIWPFRPFITRSERGRWDGGLVVHGPIVDDGDETRFYYVGASEGNWSNTEYGSGLAWIPRDRYGYRQIRGYRNTTRGPRTGSFTLKPHTLPAKPALAVNVAQVRADRTVRMELLDDSMQPVAGYSMADCLPVTQEGLRVPIRWKNHRDASELGGRTVRVRVGLDSEDFCDARTDTPRVYAVYMGSETQG